MKFIITESKLKKFLIDKLGVDLTGKIIKVTDVSELPKELENYLFKSALPGYIEKYGPLYVFLTKKRIYLYQKRGDNEIIVDKRDNFIPKSNFLKELGVYNLGLTVQDLIDTFV